MAVTELNSTILLTDPNLKSYYRLENVSDSKGSITLTNANTVTFTAAKFNNGANLSATNTNKCLHSTTDNPFALGGGAAAISLWVKMLAVPATNGIYSLFDTTDAGTTHVRFQILYKDVSGVKQFVFNRTKSPAAADTTAYVVDAGTTNFFHVVLVFTGASLIGYVNGVASTPTACSGNGVSGGTAGVALGISRVDLSSSPASALLDDVAVFNRALTASEVMSLYTGQWPGGGFLYSII